VDSVTSPCVLPVLPRWRFSMLTMCARLHWARTSLETRPTLRMVTRIVEARIRFLGWTPEAKKGEKGTFLEIEEKKTRRGCQAAAYWAVVAKEIGWVGAAAYVLCSSPTLHDTSYSAQQSKPQYRGVTGAHASEAACAQAPSRTDMLARTWSSPVLRTCLIVTTRHGRSRNQPLSNCQHGCPCCTRRGIAKPARTVTLSRRPSKQSWICCTAGSELYLVAAGHEDAQGVANYGASFSPEQWFHLMRRDKNPLHLAHIRWVL